MQSPSMSAPEGFNVVGFVSANLGLGVAARNTLRILTESGYKAAICDINIGPERSNQDSTFDHLKILPNGTLPHKINIFHMNPPELHRLLERNARWLQRKDHLNVAVPFWELSKLPYSWVPVLESMDCVLCASHFIENLVASQVSGINVRHYPQTVFLPQINVPDRSRFGLPNDCTLFISSFEMASDTGRKNPWAALAAFNKAFSEKDKARLVIKINNAHLSPSISSDTARLKKYMERNNRIIIIDENLTYPEVIALYASCDVYVSLHRAEGLGLCLMESMMLGKPVIATGWSGNMDFTNDSNSCLVDYQLIPAEGASRNFYARGYVGTDVVWADPSIADAAEWMRRLHENPELRQKIGERARQDMIERQHRCLKGNAFRDLDILCKRKLRKSQTVNSSIPEIITKRNDTLRILFQNRPDLFSRPAEDTLIMDQLKNALEAHSHIVEISSSANCELSSFDIIHLFNLNSPRLSDSFARNAHNQGIPFIVTPILENQSLYLSKAQAITDSMVRYIQGGQRGHFQALQQAYSSAGTPAMPVVSGFALEYASRILVSGKSEADYLRGLFSGINPIHHPLGSSGLRQDIGPDLFVKEFGVRDFVLCMGSLEMKRNQLMLLKALEEQDIPLVFADRGVFHQPDYAKLCRSFKRKGKTLFATNLSHDLLASSVKAAAVHCSPAFCEHPGIATLEAAYLGCPVVASTDGTIRDYLGEGCFYCEPANAESINAAVNKALETGRSGSGAALEKALQLTWERSAGILVDVYQEIMNSTRPLPEERMNFKDEVCVVDDCSFVGAVAGLIEQGSPARALQIYDHYRHKFPETNELARFDKLMQHVRETAKKGLR